MNWLRRFMEGRNGLDDLSLFLIVISLLLTVVASIFKLSLVYYVGLLNLILSYYRIFSRDRNKRYRENQKYLQLLGPYKRKFKGLSKRLKASKDYKYFKCPSCNQSVRVPRGKGKLSITCPKCKNKMIRRT